MDEDEDYELTEDEEPASFPFTPWAVAYYAAELGADVSIAFVGFWKGVASVFAGANNRVMDKIMFHEQTAIELETLEVGEGDGG